MFIEGRRAGRMSETTRRHLRQKSSFTLLILITFSNTDSNDPRRFCRAGAVFKHYAQNEMIGTSRDFTQNFEQAVNSRKAKLLSDEVTKHGH